MMNIIRVTLSCLCIAATAPSVMCASAADGNWDRGFQNEGARRRPVASSASAAPGVMWASAADGDRDRGFQNEGARRRPVASSASAAPGVMWASAADGDRDRGFRARRRPVASSRSPSASSASITVECLPDPWGDEPNWRGASAGARGTRHEEDVERPVVPGASVFPSPITTPDTVCLAALTALPVLTYLRCLRTPAKDSNSDSPSPITPAIPEQTPLKDGATNTAVQALDTAQRPQQDEQSPQDLKYLLTPGTLGLLTVLTLLTASYAAYVH